jgi:hypothetical protein
MQTNVLQGMRAMLQRVHQQRRETQMTFEVHANRKPWRFATEAEARAAANDIYSRKGIIVAITASDKPATHAYALGA